MARNSGKTWGCVIAFMLMLVIGQTGMAQPLSGTYTIGGASPSYASFGAAVTALTTNGVSGAVVFNVRAGTYSERVVLPAITGASATQTITFQSETGTASDVTLRYTPAGTSDNAVIALNSASYIRILNMTLTSYGVGTSYRCVIVLDGTAGSLSGVTIQGNVLNGLLSANNSADLSIIYGHSGVVTSNLTITHNTFNNGGYGVYLTVSGGTASTGTVIRANTFAGGWGGVSAYNHTAAVIDSNTMSVLFDAIDLGGCTGLISLQRNRIANTGGGYGITLNNCNGDALDYGLIANNFISLLGTSGDYGINVTNSTYQTIYYNSVNVATPGTGTCFYQAYGGNINVVNNVFSNPGGYYAYYVVSAPAIASSDHNALYGAGMVYLAHWGSTDCVSLPDLQVTSGMDAHSVSANPDFTSSSDLHANSPWLVGTAAVIAGLTIDIDGRTRNATTPDIGASEFTSTLTKMTGGGIFTIGGSLPSYATFTLAVNDLVSRGITGPVVFNVRPGTYAEQIDLWPVGGVSAANTITFQSETSGAVLQFTQSASNSTTNWVMRLNSASHVHLKNMTMVSYGLNTSYRSVLVLNGSVDDLLVQGDSLSGMGGSSSQSLALISGNYPWTRNMTIWGNRFGPSSYGVYILGYGNTADSGTVIKGNTFSGSYGGVDISNQPAVIIDSNMVTVTNDGIDVNLSSASVSVQRNRVWTTAGGNGISVYSCTGDALDYGLVANNFVAMTGSSGGYGITIQNSSYDNVYYNTVNMTATGSGYALYQANGGNVNLVNNILSNTGGYYAYYVVSPSAIASSDHNALYGAGMVYLAHWGSTDCVSLPALQVASGMDAHSVSSNPDFTSATNLHANSPWLVGTAAVIAGLTVDIDGNTRNATTPDIGASEFTSTLTKIAGGTYTIGGSSPTYATFTQAVNDLVSRGITGPVLLNVRPGTYAEQIDLWPVGGVSPANTITFQSETSGAVLQFTQSGINSVTNWVMRLNSASHVHLKNMTLVSYGLNTSYRCVLVLNGSVDDLLVQGDSLSGLTGNSGQTLALIAGNYPWTRNMTIWGNRFGPSSYGVYVLGYSSTGDSGTVIKGNTFSGSYGGIFISNQPVVVVDSNMVTVSNDGIDVNQSPASVSVQRNRVWTTAGGNGISLSNSPGDALDYGLIANNFVVIEGTSGGIGIAVQNSSYENVYYNSVSITATGNGYGLYQSSGGYVNLVNNVFSNTGGYYAYYVNSSSAIAISDHNALYGAGMVYLARWGSTDCISLPALQVASGMDAHSVSANPDFASSTDLHANSPWLVGTASVIAGLTIDIDGHTRNATTPDIGASEFTSTLRKISGSTYTIGGSSPTYATFTAAVNDLVARGITGPVVLNVRPGTYAEQIDLWPVGGVNAANTITFESETSGAVLQFAQSASNATTNWVMRLNAASHVHLKNMTLVSSGSNTSYRNVLVLNGSLEDLLVQGDSLSGMGGNSGQALGLIYGYYPWTRNMTIWGNRFGPSSYGVYIYGFGTNGDSGTVIKGNTFTGGFGGVNLLYQPVVVVDSNVTTGSNDGIDLTGCPGSCSIQRNKVTTLSAGSGITLNNCSGDALDYGLVANNFIAITGSSGGYGLTVENSSYQDVYFNSVNVTSSGLSGYALYSSSGTNVNIEDNILVNGGGGYAYYVAYPTALTASDYNDLTTTGASLALWAGTPYANLAALQAASSMDAHSVTEGVTFVSSTDLHLAGSSIGDNWLRGTPIAGIKTDIDGNTRSTTNPYKGANEGAIVLSIGNEPPAGGGGIVRAPLLFDLAQNYPNPFNPSTFVRFSVQKSGRASLILYDITGKKVAVLFDGTAEPGQYYQVSIEGSRLASGVYIYRLESRSQVALKKMVLLK